MRGFLNGQPRSDSNHYCPVTKHGTLNKASGILVYADNCMPHQLPSSLTGHKHVPGAQRAGQELVAANRACTFLAVQYTTLNNV